MLVRISGAGMHVQILPVPLRKNIRSTPGTICRTCSPHSKEGYARRSNRVLKAYRQQRSTRGTREIINVCMVLFVRYSGHSINTRQYRIICRQNALDARIQPELDMFHQQEIMSYVIIEYIRNVIKSGAMRI